MSFELLRFPISFHAFCKSLTLLKVSLFSTPLTSSLKTLIISFFFFSCLAGFTSWLSDSFSVFSFLSSAFSKPFSTFSTFFSALSTLSSIGIGFLEVTFNSLVSLLSAADLLELATFFSDFSFSSFFGFFSIFRFFFFRHKFSFIVKFYSCYSRFSSF